MSATSNGSGSTVKGGLTKPTTRDDLVSGAGDIAVESADQVNSVRRQPNLFLCFPQGGGLMVDVVQVRRGHPKTDLRSRMVPKMVGTLCQQYGEAIRPIHDRNQYRGAGQTVVRRAHTGIEVVIAAAVGRSVLIRRDSGR